MAGCMLVPEDEGVGHCRILVDRTGTKTWTQSGTELCFSCGLSSTLVHLDDYLYLTVWDGVVGPYDPSTDTWVVVPPAAPAYGRWFNTAPINGRLCSLMSDIDDYQTSVEVICYEEWNDPHPRLCCFPAKLQPDILGPAMAWWGNTVWLFGGDTGTGYPPQASNRFGNTPLLDPPQSP